MKPNSPLCSLGTSYLAHGLDSRRICAASKKAKQSWNRFEETTTRRCCLWLRLIIWGIRLTKSISPMYRRLWKSCLAASLPARQQTITCGEARRIIAGRPFRRCTGGSEDLGIAICRLTKGWFGMPSQGFSRRRGPTGCFAAAAPFWSSWPACSISAVRRVCLITSSLDVALLLRVIQA